MKGFVRLAAAVAVASAAVVGIIAVLLSFQNSANAATPDDVQKVIALTQDPGVNRVRREDDLIRADSVIFTDKGVQYTVYYIVGNGKSTLLAFLVWDRNGPKKEPYFVTCTLDGKVLEGRSENDGGKYDVTAKDAPPAKSQERQYWQKKLDDAIGAALEFKRRVDAERRAPPKLPPAFPKSNRTVTV